MNIINLINILKHVQPPKEYHNAVIITVSNEDVVKKLQFVKAIFINERTLDGKTIQAINIWPIKIEKNRIYTLHVSPLVIEVGFEKVSENLCKLFIYNPSKREVVYEKTYDCFENVYRCIENLVNEYLQSDYFQNLFNEFKSQNIVDVEYFSFYKGSIHWFNLTYGDVLYINCRNGVEYVKEKFGFEPIEGFVVANKFDKSTLTTLDLDEEKCKEYYTMWLSTFKNFVNFVDKNFNSLHTLFKFFELFMKFRKLLDFHTCCFDIAIVKGVDKRYFIGKEWKIIPQRTILIEFGNVITVDVCIDSVMPIITYFSTSTNLDVDCLINKFRKCNFFQTSILID